MLIVGFILKLTNKMYTAITQTKSNIIFKISNYKFNFFLNFPIKTYLPKDDSRVEFNSNRLINKNEPFQSKIYKI